MEPRPHEYAGVPQAWESIWAFLADLVTDKEHDPGDDLTSELVAVRDGTGVVRAEPPAVAVRYNVPRGPLAQW